MYFLREILSSVVLQGFRPIVPKPKSRLDGSPYLSFKKITSLSSSFPWHHMLPSTSSPGILCPPIAVTVHSVVPYHHPQGKYSLIREPTLDLLQEVTFSFPHFLSWSMKKKRSTFICLVICKDKM